MAKAILNPLIKLLSGKLDGVVYRTAPSGKTYISKSPDTPALARRCKCV